MNSEVNIEKETATKSKRLYKQSRILFCIVIVTLSFFLVWPGYTLFASPTPLILGFPLSFAWVILGTVIGFVSLYILYKMDNERERLK